MEQKKEPLISKIIILPGNGCVNIEMANWYAWMRNEIKTKCSENKLDVEVILQQMPDPNLARKSIWIPFIINDLKADEKTLLIGHSSGAEATLRLLEDYKVAAAILVSACYTDLNNKYEKMSGYYDDPWQWEKIKQNCNTIIQYHSKDDNLVPIKEGQFVAQQLQTEFHEMEDRSHFFYPEDCKEILQRVCELIYIKK